MRSKFRLTPHMVSPFVSTDFSVTGPPHTRCDISMKGVTRSGALPPRPFKTGLEETATRAVFGFLNNVFSDAVSGWTPRSRRRINDAFVEERTL